MITQENYFQKNNRALTNSKIGDFLKCKNYFYRKHILGTVEKKTTKAFTIGSATDDILTEMDNTKNYAVCKFDGRTKEGKDERYCYELEGKTILSQSDYDLIVNISDAVEKTSAYKALKDFKKQEIIQIPFDGGEHFDTLAGKPDFYMIDGDELLIVDLKTTTDLDEKKYFYNCISYRYFSQMAIYGHILRTLNPQITKTEYLHLAVAKIDDIYPVGVFRLANDRVYHELKFILEVIEQIKNEKEFNKYNPSLSKAIEIGNVVETF